MRRETVLTEKACSTRDRKRNDHAVAFVEILDGAAFFLDYAHEFVAENKIFQLRKEAVVNVQVGSADGGRGYTKNNIPRLLNSRIVYVVDVDTAGSVEDKRFHLF